ncbi:DUF3304 domain-containing protein [Duganella sacchari]|nr:DUF3304 domain-containing protein [Duganella sacchari]
MTMKQRFMARCCSAMVMCLLSLPALVACAKNTVPVSVHGVNYSGDDFSYVVIDPANDKNAAGGETIGPYAAGGTMCCYDLPTKWRSGIQIKVKAKHWLAEKANGDIPEIAETRLLDVPAYVDGKPGELWVLRMADGQLGIVSSDYQPDHAKWPGKIKGWPVPSLAYQRAQMDLHIQQEEGAVQLNENFLRDMRKDPLVVATRVWNYSTKRDPQSIAGFSGPEDKAYQAYLLKDFEAAYARAQKNLKELKERRP